MMATSEILLQLIIGGILGLVGQMLRFLVGYKKLNEEAAQVGLTASDMFQTNRFVISLIIGFVAGIIGILSLSDFSTGFFLTNVKETVMTLIGIGYAGTDFIEGFIKKYIPGNDPSQQSMEQKDSGNTPPPGAYEQPQ